jgi:hypothetical protein
MIPKKVKLKRKIKKCAKKMCWVAMKKPIANNYPMLSQGAIYKVTLDRSHPLAFGMKESYYTLKTNELRYGYLQSGWNVGVIKGNAKPVQGFAGYRINKKMSNSLVLGVEPKGQGNIIYMVDNPLFRNFWESSKMIFSNAVFMVQ